MDSRGISLNDLTLQTFLYSLRAPSLFYAPRVLCKSAPHGSPAPAPAACNWEVGKGAVGLVADVTIGDGNDGDAFGRWSLGEALNSDTARGTSASGTLRTASVVGAPLRALELTTAPFALCCETKSPLAALLDHGTAVEQAASGAAAADGGEPHGFGAGCLATRLPSAATGQRLLYWEVHLEGGGAAGLALKGAAPSTALGTDMKSWGVSVDPGAPLGGAAVLKGLFDPTSLQEAAEAASGGNSSGKWPALLTMAFPKDDPRSKVPGTYKLNEAAVVNGFPTWNQEGGAGLVMYTTSRGSWAITNASDVAANKNMCITKSPEGHHGEAPHTLGWGKVADGAWKLYPDITCTVVAATVEGMASVLPGQVTSCAVAKMGQAEYVKVGLTAPWETRKRSSLKPAAGGSGRCVVGVVLDRLTGVLGFALNPHKPAVIPGKGVGRKGCRCPKKHRAVFVKLEKTAACTACKTVNASHPETTANGGFVPFFCRFCVPRGRKSNPARSLRAGAWGRRGRHGVRPVQVCHVRRLHRGERARNASFAIAMALQARRESCRARFGADVIVNCFALQVSCPPEVVCVGPAVTVLANLHGATVTDFVPAVTVSGGGRAVLGPSRQAPPPGLDLSSIWDAIAAIEHPAGDDEDDAATAAPKAKPPAAAAAAVGAKTGRPTVGDKVVLVGTSRVGDLNPGELATITRDDGDSQPYRVNSRDYWYRESHLRHATLAEQGIAPAPAAAAEADEATRPPAALVLPGGAAVVTPFPASLAAAAARAAHPKSLHCPKTSGQVALVAAQPALGKLTSETALTPAEVSLQQWASGGHHGRCSVMAFVHRRVVCLRRCQDLCTGLSRFALPASITLSHSHSS